jgi:SAM-dependent methyltransferase
VKRSLVPRLHQARIDEALEVVAQGRSGQVDVGLNVAGSDAAVATLNDEAQDGKPNGMAEGAELFGVAVELRGHLLLLVNSKDSARANFDYFRRISGSAGQVAIFLHARRIEVANVDFRLGEIEHLPVPDASVDVILSNCVINLSPDKATVFREAFRALKPGGRLAISDVVAVQTMPRELAESVEALTGCVAGSAKIDELRALLADAGFESVKIEPRPESGRIIGQCMPGAEDYVASATIEAKKPGGSSCCAPSCCT